jgi:lipopolysaccharide export system protein LptC
MDRYSRGVAILKVALPLAALALLSTLFLLSRSVDPEATIPFAHKEVVKRIRGQQVTGPVYTGVTRAGDELIITASAANPSIGDVPASASDLMARITRPDGTTIQMNADRGILAQETDIASFRENVVITTSAGYVITTAALDAELAAVAATAPGAIRGTGPLGDFTAGEMKLTTKSDTGAVRILFNGGVKLIYDPKQQER